VGNPDFMNIQYDTITQFVQELTAINSAGQQLINDLTTTLHGNTELWNGVAKLGYEQVHQKWNSQFAWMGEVLAAMQGHGTQTHDLYQEIEARNTAMWGGQ
jgi:uncharacterized protein YukE